MSFEAGQNVIVYRFSRPVSLVTVERVTKTLAIAGNRRFRQADGYEVGTSFIASRRITNPTAEGLKKLARMEMLDKVKFTKWDSLDDETLARVVQALDGR